MSKENQEENEKSSVNKNNKAAEDRPSNNQSVMSQNKKLLDKLRKNLLPGTTGIILDTSQLTLGNLYNVLGEMNIKLFSQGGSRRQLGELSEMPSEQLYYLATKESGEPALLNSKDLQNLREANLKVGPVVNVGLGEQIAILINHISVELRIGTNEEESLDLLDQQNLNVRYRREASWSLEAPLNTGDEILNIAEKLIESQLFKSVEVDLLMPNNLLME